MVKNKKIGSLVLLGIFLITKFLIASENVRLYHRSDEERAKPLIVTLPGNKGIEWLSKAKIRGYRDVILDILVETDKDFANAYRKFQMETGDARESFEKLLKRPTQKVPDRYVIAQAHYFVAKIDLADKNYASAAVSLDKALESHLYLAKLDDALLHRAICYVKSEDRATDREKYDHAVIEAYSLISLMMPDEFGQYAIETSERIKEACLWLAKELKGGGSGPLTDLAARMERLSGQLAQNKTDGDVQKKQQRIIDDLDKLIEKASDTENKAKQDTEAAAAPGRESRERAAGGPQDLRKSIDDKSKEDFALQALERQKVIQFVNERLPERYRGLIEQYYKGIAKVPLDPNKMQRIYPDNPKAPPGIFSNEKKPVVKVRPWFR